MPLGGPWGIGGGGLLVTDSLSRDVGGTTSTALASALRHRWYAVVLGVLFGLALAQVYVSSQPVSYISTASVLVSPVGVAADLPDRKDGVDLDTELQIVRSETVALSAQKLLDSPIPGTELAKRVSVTIPPNTSVLAVSFVAPTAVAAQQGAHAFAQSYVEVRTADAKVNLTRKIDALEAETTKLETRLLEVAEKIASLPADSTNAVVANAQRTVLINQISTIEAKTGPLRAASTTAGKIIDDANLPKHPAGPTVPLTLGSGALVGLLLGLCLALVIDRLDGRLRDADAVERRLRLPVLAHAPRVRAAPISLAEPASVVGQSFSELRNVLVSSPGKEHGVIVITGAAPGPGGGFVTANLAYALARAGHDVLVVAADESSPCASLLGVRPEPGVTRLPGSREGLPEYRTALSGLVVCVPIVDFDGGFDWIERGTFASLISANSARDYVLIDAPSAAVGSRTQSIVLQGDTTVVVVESRRTTSKQVAFAYRKLERMGVRVQGVVVVPQLTRRLAVVHRGGAAAQDGESVLSALGKARGN